MARTPRKTGSERNGYKLPDDKLQQREAVFMVYLDLGPARSMHKLAEVLKADHPEIAVNRTSLERWSKLHDWAARVKAHDSAAKALPPVLTAPIKPLAISEDFDQVDALMQAANQMLLKAMNATPVATKPGDVKAMIDSAANALKLVETIKTNQVGKVSRQEVATEIGRILDEVEKARSHDVELLVEEAMKSGGWVKVEQEQVDAVAPVEVYHVAIDADEPDTLEIVVDGEPEPAAAETGVGLVEEKVRLFTDVLKSMQGGGS